MLLLTIFLCSLPNVAIRIVCNFLILDLQSHCSNDNFVFGNKQEPEVEYVEGYDELEEEDDIEDLGDFTIHESQHDHDVDDENGKV